jgi:hypothetical protein
MRIRNIAVHRNVTEQAIIEACERRRTTLDNPGFCILCGVEAEGVEPDAQGYTCESCGGPFVYGAEELLMCLAW